MAGVKRVRKRKVQNLFRCLVCLVVILVSVGEYVKTVEAAPLSQTPRKIEEFKHLLDEQVPVWQDKYDVPGLTVGIVHEGRVAYLLNYGYADKKNKIELTDQTLFQAGSISKSVTAWGVLKLVEKGLVSLDDPVEKYLTSWKLPDAKFNPDEVTIKRLLSHTAGLSAHKGYLGTAPQSRLSSIEDSLNGKGLFNEPVRITDTPGEKEVYSGGGYTILQLVIEEVTGMAFERYMEEEVLKPLGMDSSSFHQDPNDPRMSKAYGYFGQELPNYQFTEQAAAGLKTNSTDMMKLILASMDHLNRMQGNGLLENELVEEMQQPVIGESGLGVFIRKLSEEQTFIYHSGDNRGWHSLYGFIPETKEGLVILTNSDNGIDLRQDIYHAWIEYVTGSLPEGHSSLTQSRTNNFILSISIGTLFGIYVIMFGIRMATGRRVFFTKLKDKYVVKLGCRTLLLVAAGALLFYASYVWQILNLSSGRKDYVMLILAWLFVLVLTGFYPKKRKLKSPERSSFNNPISLNPE
ncbi:serine hydrolase domain-containing protein [Paenibacillus sp. FSL W8-0426]|uniref:serine hydrolase domain-containing protein n=1 Tax=Paenibacillus sp. FSL W8-0426 TaxID=2921714 RepID=UPI0030D94C29